MDQIFAAIKPLLDALGVQPWMYPILLAFGVLHQYAKGTLRSWTQEWSFASAAVLSVAFGVLSAVEVHLTPVEGLTRTIILFAACLVAEGLAAKLAEFAPWIPQNNEWTKPPPEEGKP